MKAWGRIIGSALGIPAGVPGIAFGFLIGFLIDRAFEHRSSGVRFERFIARPEDTDVDRGTGILYLVLGLLNEAAASGRWGERHRELLAETGARPVDEPERRELLATARARGAFSYRACLAWARRNMDQQERSALITFLLLPESSEEGAGAARVEVARRVADSFELSPEARKGIWKRAHPLPSGAAALVGVDDAADDRGIQGAFRLLASQFHPDSLAVLEEPQRQEATEAFVRIRAAYERIRPLATIWFSRKD